MSATTSLKFASVLVLALVALVPYSLQKWAAHKERAARAEKNIAMGKKFLGRRYELCVDYRDRSAGNDQCRALRGCVDRGTRAISAMLEREPSLEGKVSLLEDLGDLNQYIPQGLLRSSRFYSEAAGLLQEQQPEASKNIWMLLVKSASSHLRYGELQNCIKNHNAKSCIFPLEPQAYHADRAGSTRAIADLEKAWQIHQNGLARWLLNIAYMTLGKYPAGVPEEILIPVRHFESDEPFPRFPNVALDAGVARMLEEGGAMIEDLNGDGLHDILLTSRGCQSVVYLENRGDGTFDDKSRVSGLGAFQNISNAAQGDFDNDGKTDLYLTRGSWDSFRSPFSSRGTLLRNLGEGKFKDVTAAAGLGNDEISSAAAVWLDYDGDGALDLFVCNESREPYLYRNLGNGAFINRAPEAGLENFDICKGVALGDANGDGWPDLFLANYAGPNKLYLNTGNASFEERTPENLKEHPRFAIAAWFFDWDNNGRQDLFVAGFNFNMELYVSSLIGEAPPGLGSRLFSNEERGFRDVSEASGIGHLVRSMSAGYGDLNNDGYEDLMSSGGGQELWGPGINKMFLNKSGERFSDVTMSGGFGSLQKTHGISIGDLNGDGYPDVLVNHGGAYPSDEQMTGLYENPGRFGNKWLQLRLEGTVSNRSAIGAKVEIHTSQGKRKRRVYRWVQPGTAYQSSPLLLNIGMGKAEKVDGLTVYWPRPGREEAFGHIALNSRLIIREGSGKAEVFSEKKLDTRRKKRKRKHEH